MRQRLIFILLFGGLQLEYGLSNSYSVLMSAGYKEQAEYLSTAMNSIKQKQ